MSTSKLIEKPATKEQNTALPSEQPAGKTWTAVAFFCALVLFAVANVSLCSASHYYQPDIAKAITADGAEINGHTKPWSWWLARGYLQQKTPAPVVMFGSSQMGSAMCAADAQHLHKIMDALKHRNPATLEDEIQARIGKHVDIFSLSSPGAMCSDALMASRALFKPGMSPKLVIIGVSPRDFIDNTMPYPAATEPYRFYSQYASPGSLLSSAYIGPMAWLQYAVESLPFKRLGTYLQSAVAYEGRDPNRPISQTAEEISRAGASPMVAILGGAAIPGKWNVPANIPRTLWDDNTKEYKNRFKNPNPPVYACERKFFAQFMEDMHKQGIKVLVVGMPSLPMNRVLLPETFWQDFRGMIKSQCNEYGDSFLDLSDSPIFVKSDYLDTVHLNAWGGMKLFAEIAEYATRKDPSLAAILQN